MSKKITVRSENLIISHNDGQVEIKTTNGKPWNGQIEEIAFIFTECFNLTTGDPGDHWDECVVGTETYSSLCPQDRKSIPKEISDFFIGGKN